MRLLTALLCTVSSAALAADLPSRREPPAFIPAPAPIFTWSGAYIGGNAGYAFDNRTNYQVAGTNAAGAAAVVAGAQPGFVRQSDNGFTGGLQIGYNFELGATGLGVLPLLGALPIVGSFGGGGLVFGVEADAAYTDLRDTSLLGAGASTSTFQSRIDFVGTARGRLGIAIANALVYGTGGFAYGGVRNTVTFTGPAAATGSQDRIKTGYAYGGGIEYAIPTSSFVNVFQASAVTLKAEYLHYELGNDTLTSGGGAGAFTMRVRNDGNIVRGGINYKFGTTSLAPVVARF